MSFIKKTLILCTLLLVLCSSGCRSGSDSDNDTPGKTLSYVKLPTSAEEIDVQLRDSMAKLNKEIGNILARDNHTFENTVHALNDALYENEKTLHSHDLASNLSPIEEVRTAGESAYMKNKAAQRQVFINEDLYLAIRHVSDTDTTLTGQEKRLVNELKTLFERNGINLNESDQAVLDEVSREITRLESEFNNNVDNYDHTVVFAPEELRGVPASDLALFSKTEGGSYEMDPRLLSQMLAIITYAENDAAREKAYIAYYSVAKEQNPPILERIVQLRAQKAGLLNYPTYADLVTSNRMARSAQTAMTFLDRLSAQLEDKLAQEKATLLDMKKTHTGNQEAVLNSWDMSFYENRYDKEHFNIDHEAMKKYFSMDRCLEGMFDTFESVFQIEIIKKETEKDALWHDDVTLYQVSDKTSGEVLGLFYLDLYPREGKFSYFATHFTFKGNSFKNGPTETPAAVLMGNWFKPTAGNPSLLSFFELTTLFHEFGHTLHLILMDTKYAYLHDNSWDFIEVPSQMAERWCFDQRILSRFAVNYQDPSDTLPEDYTEKIKKADTAFSALFLGGQIAYGMTDLTLHTAFGPSDGIDGDAVYREMGEKHYIKRPDETSSVARFTHLAGGYDAGYYSYLWSLAIVHDLETVFDQTPAGLMDQQTGIRLKQNIFMPGKTRDEDESVHTFLNRDWTTDAFIRYLEQE